MVCLALYFFLLAKLFTAVWTEFNVFVDYSSALRANSGYGSLNLLLLRLLTPSRLLRRWICGLLRSINGLLNKHWLENQSQYASNYTQNRND